MCIAPSSSSPHFKYEAESYIAIADPAHAYATTVVCDMFVQQIDVWSGLALGHLV